MHVFEDYNGPPSRRMTLRLRAYVRGIEPPAEDYVMLMLTEDDCDFMSFLPEADDVPGGCDVLCDETYLDSNEEKEEATFSIACASGRGMDALRSVCDGAAAARWRVGARCARLRVCDGL